MKKLIGLLLALCLCGGMLAGCGSTDGTTSPASANNGTEGAPAGDTTGDTMHAEHETFTLWLYSTPTDYYASYSDNPVVQYLNQRFNVTLEFEQPSAGTEADSLSLMFGTGDYTDLIESSSYTGSIGQLYDDGIIVNIADYLEYMPNYKQLLDTDEVFRRISYDDEGNILVLKSIYNEDRMAWGGFVYRHDILETMTGGNVAFPSGNAEPTTLDDWDYMLPLFKAYFEAAGMTNSAPLIIPYNGYYPQGQLANGFGVSPMYYQRDGEVHFGAMEQGFYNYLQKLNEWYEAGYIYPDFASRSNDPFYLPNPELTYGGAAGIWFGMLIQLGDALSMPEYGLEMDVRAMPDPLDTDNGIQKAYAYSMNDKADVTGGYFVSSSCQNIPRLLSILDYLYSEEGSMLVNIGLTAEQGAADDPIYSSLGLEEGAYWFEDGQFVYNSNLHPAGGDVDLGQMSGSRLCGLFDIYYENMMSREDFKAADKIWNRYWSEEEGALPTYLAMPAADSVTYANNNVMILDHINSMVPKFIMGTVTLDDTAWNEYVDQLKAYGIEENLEIQQRAYDAYLAR